MKFQKYFTSMLYQQSQINLMSVPKFVFYFINLIKMDTKKGDCYFYGIEFFLMISSTDFIVYFKQKQGLNRKEIDFIIQYDQIRKQGQFHVNLLCKAKVKRIYVTIVIECLNLISFAV